MRRLRHSWRALEMMRIIIKNAATTTTTTTTIRSSATRSSFPFCRRAFTSSSSSSSESASSLDKEKEEKVDDDGDDDGFSSWTKKKLRRDEDHVLGSCRAKTVGFTVETEREALQIFERWLKRDPLRPRKVVDSSSGGGGGPTVLKTLIPYWKFADVSFRVKYKAKVGFSGKERREGKGGGEDGDVEWQEIEEWREFNDGEAVRYDFEKDAAARQFATFSVRPDFARLIEPPASLAGIVGEKGETEGEVEEATKKTQNSRDVTVLPFEIKRSFAWTLALANIRDDLREKASKELKDTFSTDHVKDVLVHLEVLSRGTPLAVYLPAYLVEFTHGHETEKKETIRYLRRSAIVCGTSGNVACDELACSTRAMGIGGISMSTLTFMFSGMTDYGLSFLSGVVSAALLSHYAKTLDFRSRAQQKKDREDVIKEHNAFNFATEQSINWLDECAQLARDDAEWSRWKRTKREDWVNEERKSWALAIWENQVYRRRERNERREELESQRAQKLEAERRAEEKRLKWGDDWDRASRKAANRGLSTDSQSFYKILELDDKRNEATIEEIKDSYRRLAHRWHPDKKGGKVEKFQMIQKAYLTLGNKLRRETYDQI
jgi:hypothetical protein